MVNTDLTIDQVKLLLGSCSRPHTAKWIASHFSATTHKTALFLNRMFLDYFAANAPAAQCGHTKNPGTRSCRDFIPLFLATRLSDLDLRTAREIRPGSSERSAGAQHKRGRSR